MFSTTGVKYEYVVLPAFGPVPRGRVEHRDDVLEALRELIGRLAGELAPRSMYAVHHGWIERSSVGKRKRAARRAQLEAYQAWELEELPDPMTAREAVYLTRVLRAWLDIPHHSNSGHMVAMRRHAAAVNKLIAVFNQRQEEIERFEARRATKSK